MLQENAIPVIDITREDGEASQTQDEPQTRQGAMRPDPRQRVPRAIVDSFHLASLVTAYNSCFAEYSSTRKNVTQLIPSLVWKEVHLLYRNSFPDSPFSEETLKDRLRETLKELKTGTSNVDNASKVVLQDDDVLTRLKATKSHCGRNVLQKRSTFISALKSSQSNVNVTDSVDSGTTQDDNSEPTPTRQEASVGPTVSKGVSRAHVSNTKARSLRDQASGISAIAEVMRLAQESRQLLMQAKAEKIKIQNLKCLLQSGAINDADFKEKAHEIMRAM